MKASSYGDHHCVRAVVGVQLGKMLRMCPLTVSSEILRWSAIILFEQPSPTMRSTSISRAERRRKSGDWPLGSDLGRDAVFAGVNGANGFHQFFAQHALQQ